MDTHTPQRKLRMTPARGLALYLLAGAAWVFVGDALMAQWLYGAERAPSGWHMLKGVAFVLLSGLLCWWLLERMRGAEQQRGALVRELAYIVRHAPAGIVRVDPQGMAILWANDRLGAWLGLAPQTLPGRDLRELVPPVDAALSARLLQALLTGQASHYQGEHVCRPAGSGPEVLVLCQASMVPSADGQPAHLVCVLQDLGEVGAARAALAHSQRVLSLALEGSGSGLWDWDLVRQRYTYSPSVLRLLRHPDPEGTYDHPLLLERLHPDDRQRVRQALQQTLDSGAPFDETARLRRFDDSWCWVQTRGQRHLNAAGDPERCSGIVTDLSARRAADERQRLAATVVENTIEGVVVTDAQMQILSVNASFTRLLGYHEDELRGLTPRVFKSGRHDKAFYRAMWDSMKRTGHWQGEIWNRRKDGEIFPERMSLSAVHDAQGTLTHYVCMFTDISEEKQQQERLEFLAHCDPLTGLANRLWFGEQLQDAVQQAARSGELLAVLLLNLDRFKDVNGSWGHAVGDQVLQHISAQVRSALRPGDLIGRLAGDEIAVVVRHLRHADGAAAVARNLIGVAARPWLSPDGVAVVVGVSIGICTYPEQADSAQQLLQGAHAAVYGAKARGRGAYCFFTEQMTQDARERLQIESRLRQALALGHLRLHYQPQVDVASGRITGAEALVRWLDPEEGLISPARFIPVAESSGVIGALGDWVLREACRQGRRWRDAGLPELRLAVNVSPRQFHLNDVAGSAAQALAESGFSARCLELELTESALAERPEEARQTLLRLHALGVHIAVDDFGTGYSSLAHLKRFPIDVLKIDQGFIRDIPVSGDDMAISAAIIAMGHSLGLQIVAEGVETAAQLDFLRARGCDLYQGWLCSRPLPPEQFEALLRAQAPQRAEGEAGPEGAAGAPAGQRARSAAQ